MNFRWISYFIAWLSKAAWRGRAFGAACGVGLLALGGCASNEIKWTEEVRLHDGSVVQTWV